MPCDIESERAYRRIKETAFYYQKRTAEMAEAEHAYRRQLWIVIIIKIKETEFTGEPSNIVLGTSLYIF